MTDLLEAPQWKCAEEFLPYHPQASHVGPDHRDGWNACYRMASAEIKRLTEAGKYDTAIIKAAGLQLVDLRMHWETRANFDALEAENEALRTANARLVQAVEALLESEENAWLAGMRTYQIGSPVQKLWATIRAAAIKGETPC